MGREIDKYLIGDCLGRVEIEVSPSPNVDGRYDEDTQVTMTCVLEGVDSGESRIFWSLPGSNNVIRERSITSVSSAGIAVHYGKSSHDIRLLFQSASEAERRWAVFVSCRLHRRNADRIG